MVVCVFGEPLSIGCPMGQLASRLNDDQAIANGLNH